MNLIKQTGDQDLKAIFSQVADLCGYPKLTDEKYRSTADFVRRHFGQESTELILKAFDSLALGSLDEKMDNYKSLTGLAVSRVIDAYRRNHTNKNSKDNILVVDGKEVERWPLNPDARALIKEKTGRVLFYSDQVTDSDHDLLMDFYILEAQKQYQEGNRTTAIIPQMYDYLESSGRWKVWQGKLMKCYGVDETVICDIDDIEELAAQIIRNETITSNNSTFLRGAKIFKTNAEDARKKAIIIKYLES